LNRSERVLAEGKDTVSPPERQRSSTASHMPALSKPPTGRSRREDIPIAQPLPSTVEEDGSDSEIEVVLKSAKAIVSEENEDITPLLEKSDDPAFSDESITPPPAMYDPALVDDQGIF